MFSNAQRTRRAITSSKSVLSLSSSVARASRNGMLIIFSLFFAESSRADSVGSPQLHRRRLCRTGALTRDTSLRLSSLATRLRKLLEESNEVAAGRSASLHAESHSRSIRKCEHFILSSFPTRYCDAFEFRISPKDERLADVPSCTVRDSVGRREGRFGRSEPRHQQNIWTTSRSRSAKVCVECY